jgi:hypothetical protein
MRIKEQGDVWGVMRLKANLSIGLPKSHGEKYLARRSKLRRRIFSCEQFSTKTKIDSVNSRS